MSLRFSLQFLAFVVAGSLALLAWLGMEESRRSTAQFAAIVEANGELLRRERYPKTERTAQALSEILRMEVTLEPEGDRRVVPELENGFWPVGDGLVLVLRRPPPRIWRTIASGRTLAALGVFWLLSFALAAALARGIVRPLRNLAARMPEIGVETAAPLPEAARADEIGRLARAYDDTRAQLAAERRAREQAERMATLGRMAAGLAHEINNPVAAIKLHAQLLEAEAPGESLDTILAENARIEALVNQWMFLARPQPPVVARCEIELLVAAVLRALGPAARHAGVRISTDLAPGLSALADRRRLEQVLSNVAMNAIHAMTGGGELAITARSSGSNCELVFKDTGPGFSAAALARGAEIFFSEKEGGMGIGLSVCTEIVKAHGGSLRLENWASGAVVTIALPAAIA